MGGNLLIEPPLGIAEAAGERIVGNDAPANLVRHHDDGGGATCKRGKQRCAFGGKIVFGQHVVGQPECGAIDEDGLVLPSLAKGGAEVERGFDGFPCRATVGAVRCDAVTHLVVPRLGGGDVAAGRAAVHDKGFGKPRFAGARPADHQREAGKQENFVGR